MDPSRTVPVERVVRDSSRHATLHVRDPLLAGYEPGQFAMVWAPGVDEVPMAIWGGQDGIFSILIEAKGDCSAALVAKRPGDLVGIRGPYGRPFQVRGRRLLVVVGGTGTSPLVPFCQRARGKAEIDVIVGARSAEFLLLVDDFKAAGARVHVATDDGSAGFHGRAPELARRLMAEDRYDDVLTCGPELMMRAVVDLARERGTPVQASVERWMKCAVGICDACLLDGVRLCRDGPVLDGATLAASTDFGRFEREPSGRRVPLHTLAGGPTATPQRPRAPTG